MKRQMLLISGVVLLSLLLFSASSKAYEGDNDIQVNDESKDIAAQVETTIVVNPTDPMNVIGGAYEIMKDGTFHCAYYTSLDGGKTWPFSGLLPISKELPNSADPDLAVDANGNIYYAYINAVRDEEGYFTERNLTVAKSTDKGMTFSDPVIVVTSDDEPDLDKELLTADTTDSPYSGNLYLAWTSSAINVADTIRFSRSTDGGANWTIPQTISEYDPSSVQYSRGMGASPAVGPNGEVYVVWWGIGIKERFSSLPDHIYMDKSTDGGITFGTDILVTDVNQLSYYDHSDRPTRLPSFDVDRTDGSYRGNLYITWDDRRNGDSDIYFIRSTDGGKTWDEPIRINNDAVRNDKDQFFPALTVDSTGRIHLIFYDRREDPENVLTNLYYTYSDDGGQTFSKNVKVSDYPFDPNDSDVTQPAQGWPGFIGDYIQVAASSTTVFPLWPVARKENGYGDVDIFTALTVGIDTDGDGLGDKVDNCPGDYNPIQEDDDGDEIGDVCDNCPNDSNPPSGSNYYQDDRDFDTVGDVCDCALNNPKEPGQDGECQGCGAVSLLLPVASGSKAGGIILFGSIVLGICLRVRRKA